MKAKMVRTGERKGSDAEATSTSISCREAEEQKGAGTDAAEQRGYQGQTPAIVSSSSQGRCRWSRRERLPRCCTHRRRSRHGGQTGERRRGATGLGRRRQTKCSSRSALSHILVHAASCLLAWFAERARCIAAVASCCPLCPS